MRDVKSGDPEAPSWRFTYAIELHKAVFTSIHHSVFCVSPYKDLVTQKCPLFNKVLLYHFDQFMETPSEMEEFSIVRRPTIKPSTNLTGSHNAQIPDEEIKAIVAQARHPQELV